MKCKFCKNQIPDGSIFCNWCGERQIKAQKSETAIRVPRPRKLKSGKWNIELRAEGQSITEDTLELCISKAQAIRAGFIESKKKAPGMTLSEAIDKYILSHYALLSPSTVRGYRVIQRNRFKGVMHKPVGSIVNWQDAINSEIPFVSPKTLRNSWRFVASVLRETGVEPPRVHLPSIQKKERPWLNYEQIILFIKAVKGRPCEIPALLALHSLRRSELLALTWDKIDLKNKRIIVSGALVPTEQNTYVFKETNKTASSTRTVPIMIPALYDALSSVQDKTGVVVTCFPNTVMKQINQVCKTVGLPQVGVHGLRHSFASLGYHLKLSEAEIMSIGGWSDYTTIHNVYLHLAKEDILKAENQMARFYQDNA